MDEDDVREAINLHANAVEEIELFDSGDKMFVRGTANPADHELLFDAHII